MNKWQKITIGISVAAIGLFSIAAVNEAWNQFQLNVKRPATMGGSSTGTPEKLGQLTVESDAAARKGIVIKAAASQTANLLDVLDSAGSSLAKIDKDGDLTATTVTSTGSNSFADATFSGKVTINDNLLVDGDGVSDVQATIQAAPSQAVDTFVVEASNGTNWLTVNSAGAITCSQAFTASSTAAVTGNATIGGTLVTTGNGTFNAGLNAAAKTSDPCGTLPAGSIFYNSTGSIMCYCDVNATDLKIDGSSASCF